MQVLFCQHPVLLADVGMTTCHRHAPVLSVAGGGAVKGASCTCVERGFAHAASAQPSSLGGQDNPMRSQGVLAT